MEDDPIEFDNPDDAAAFVERLAAKLGYVNLPPGMVVELKNEAGDVVATIPVGRRHS